MSNREKKLIFFFFVLFREYREGVVREENENGKMVRI